MTPEPNSVLVTGASGFLGQYILAELLADPQVRCRVLLRPPLSESFARLERLLADLGLELAALVADDRVVAIEGSLPDRLNAAAFDGVDTVVHAAGNTAFHANGSGEPTRTNVDGTRAMLTMAGRAGVGRFVLVSTAYTCGEQTGHLPEVFHPTLPPVRNDYERSKWEAERLVWQWSERSRVATICRPSILFGDSQTGRASAMKGLYVVARATEILARAMDSSDTADRHHIPLRILGRGDATCNVVPIDWAARQIAGIALKPAAEPSVHHITNADPPTHEEVKQWFEDYFDIGGGRFSDAAWPLRDANHYEDLFYSLGNICLDYFRHGLTFASRCAEEIPAGRRLVDRESFFRCMQYAQSTNWGRTLPGPGRAALPAEPIDPQWYFEKFLPTAVPRSTIAKVESLTAVVKYTITNRVNRSWVGRFDQGQLAEIHRMPAELSPEFEYRLTYEDFESVVTCRKPLQEVFFHGSAEMFGDVELALKMVPVIGEF
ncbi:MAG: SDR family oxidoreductase, partial [Phycisphaerae bacterium]